jgi:membrane-bound lytic murein transglycosylase B
MKRLPRTHARFLGRPLASLQRLAALAGLLVAVACASTTPKPPPAPGRPVSIPMAPGPASGNAKFDAFLVSARASALSQGISAATFDSATAGLKPLAAILQRNANQPEFVKPVWSYLDSAVSARRIADAKTMLARYGDVLDRIAAESGVPKEILVAIWGMETDYGAVSGGFPLFAALATLAYEGPRTAYARPEFFAALKIYQQQHYPLSRMVGSWAGAFGQTQFTPTTFLKYAADGDGDRRIDLWQSAPDALASAARLLAAQGWQSGRPWGYEVTLPQSFPYAEAVAAEPAPIAHWTALGVTRADGGPLDAADGSGAIYLPAGARGPAFLLLANFNVILKYNNAASYALAVGLLADAMAGAPPLKAAWPRDERPLSRDERVAFQQALAMLGFDPGPADGILGQHSRAALRQYQTAHGLAADGFPTAALLERLQSETARR